MANRVILSHFRTATGLFEATEFFVEAKLGRRWTRVGGPFADRASAEKFAQDYGNENNVETRVVAFQ